jgi:PEGA domain
MKRMTALGLLFLSAALLTGCVERRYVITSDPPGALVLRNGQPIGATPVDDHFVYYGEYDFTLIKEGYETLQVKQRIPTPWYEFFPLDVVSEILVPWQIEDVRRFHYTLEPRRQVNTDQLLQDAQSLRNRGHSLPTPETVPPPTPVAPPP